MVSRLACARWGVEPGASLPTAWNSGLPRSDRALPNSAGKARSHMVAGSQDVRAENRADAQKAGRCHSDDGEGDMVQLQSAADGRRGSAEPGLLSPPGMKKRPSAGLSPSVSKYCFVTNSPNTRSGRVSVRSVITIGGVNAAKPRNEACCSA